VFKVKIFLEKYSKWIILAITSIVIIASIILSFNVKTNYDMTEYLPDDSSTNEGIEVLEDTFGNHALVEVMVKDVTLIESYTIKQDIEEVSGVQQVVWLDNYGDITNPDTIDQRTLQTFYNDSNALFRVVFFEDSYAIEVEESIDDIKILLGDEGVYYRGEPIENIASRDLAEDEFLKILLIIIPICFIILIFASKSWIEPLIILTVLGVGVVINLGTNAFLPSVSFITLTIAAALQLAISLDYSLFYIHRYYEYRDEGLEVPTAINKAFKKALPIITASALTTMIGFIALFFMRYGIGFDIGIVLTKGILFSYLSVFFVLPVLILILSPWIEKTRHRHFMFNLNGLRHIFAKFRYVILALFVLILTFGLIFQHQSEFFYGNNQYSDQESEVYKDNQEISSSFGNYQTVTILLKDSSKAEELSLLYDLSQNDNIIQVDALYSQIDPATPESMIPDAIKNQYTQSNYTRMTIYTDIVEESDAYFDFNDQLENMVEQEYDEYYMLGIISSTSEIKDTVIEDTPIVLWVSIGLIFIVLLIVFKNVMTSILLIGVIQAAIWLNVGLLAVNDRQVIYIGYLVVLALQLGATIDYAVLFASRYLESRKSNDKNVAMSNALKRASIPIMISGFVLAGAGFSEMIFSNIKVVSDIGLLIGRGALLSLGMVLLVLPALILILDPIIRYKKKKFSNDTKG
jgi:hypothetical protein